MALQRKDAARADQFDQITPDAPQPSSSNPSISPLPIPTTAKGDIADALTDWAHEPGTINVRKIIGQDGREKLQMRLELGLLQMETTGRPDGDRPFGRESLLHHHVTRLRRHKRRNGSAWGFALSPDDCAALRSEAAMYYQRYLSFFVLDDFAAVARDTKRNLQAMSLCRRFGTDESDQLAMEGFRPYLLMMHHRAVAAVTVERGEFAEAEAVVRLGLRRIRRCYRRFATRKAFEEAEEVQVLQRVLEALTDATATDPRVMIERRIKSAVASEDYEQAAVLRDELARLQAA